MDINTPEERHGSSGGNSSETAEASAQGEEKPTVILVIGDCAMCMTSTRAGESLQGTTWTVQKRESRLR